MARNFSRFDKYCKPTDPVSSTNSKPKKHDESYTKVNQKNRMRTGFSLWTHNLPTSVLKYYLIYLYNYINNRQ